MPLPNFSFIGFLFFILVSEAAAQVEGPIGHSQEIGASSDVLSCEDICSGRHCYYADLTLKLPNLDVWAAARSSLAKLAQLSAHSDGVHYASDPAQRGLPTRFRLEGTCDAVRSWIDQGRRAFAVFFHHHRFYVKPYCGYTVCHDGYYLDKATVSLAFARSEAGLRTFVQNVNIRDNTIDMSHRLEETLKKWNAFATTHGYDLDEKEEFDWLFTPRPLE